MHLESFVLVTHSGPLILDLGDELRTSTVEPLCGPEEREATDGQRVDTPSSVAPQRQTSRGDAALLN
jgi:hypothetical protein